MSLLVLRCLELVLPFRMVELRILQLKLMSPHREPSPVHYVTKSPVSAAYLRGRWCCLCQRDFIFRQPSSHILVFKSVIPVFFAWACSYLYIHVPRPCLILDPLANKLSLHLFLGPGCENLKTFRECCENEGS